MTAAVYARISLDRLDGEGVERQLADCRELALSHGHTDTVAYVDNDVSAFRSKRRPEWDRLLADLTANRITHLYAWHPDRLYRRLADLEDLIAAADGVELHTVKAGDVDLSTASGRMIARILGSVSRHESERMGERVRRAKIDRAAEGKPAGGGRRPTGLDVTRTDLVETEAAMLREVAANILAGESWNAEVRRLNNEGHRTSTGARWSISTLRRTLTNPYVAGLRTYRGEIVGQATWPAILDRATFDALRSRIGRPQGPRRAGTHLLTGHIRCHCGRRMYAHRTRTGWTYRCPPNQETNGTGCGTSIMRDPTDQQVITTVGEWVNDPGFLDALLHHLNPGDDPSSRLELEAVESRLADLARRFAAGELLELEHAAARTELVERRKALMAHTPRPVTNLDVSRLPAAWAAANEVAAQRQLIGIVTRPVVIFPKDHLHRVQLQPAWA